MISVVQGMWGMNFVNGRVVMYQSKTETNLSTQTASKGRVFWEREDGSLTIFGLFLFILILMISGTAVDLMLHERTRVKVQNSLDTAVLAAGSLNSGASTDAEIITMVKDYVSKAGVNSDIVTVYPGITGASSKVVGATAQFKSNTMFMNMMGIDKLHGTLASEAAEAAQFVEIVLVLDVSGSMSQDGKIEALRPAAKGFITEVISRLGEENVAISIVPYNHLVHLDAATAAEIDWDDQIKSVPGAAASYAGSVENFRTRNPGSRCARFDDADFNTTSLVSTPKVEANAMFSDSSSNNLGQYANSQAWCSESYAPVFLFQNQEKPLHDFIDTLEGRGWTSIDYGMNWGLGILDTDFRPVVKGLTDANVLPAEMEGLPAAFNEPDVTKIVVLMTDGINTLHQDLDEPFKEGPSRIWSSEILAAGIEMNGFMVEMPGNAESQRWYVPGDPADGGDDSYISEAEFVALTDKEQWDYHRVYDRFRAGDVADYFFGPDAAARAAHGNALIDTGSDGVADTRTRAVCQEARDAEVDVYTIAFQAPDNSETLLRDCAGADGRYFDVDGLDIAEAFDAIAIQLSKLRLTQ